MRARAVIGASYGDEGKGQTVEWLSGHDPRGTVTVRSNGGAQAAHTVVTPSGNRHVFHHFGSASLRGGRTHLSRFMVSHPLVFHDEFANLVRLDASTLVSADPQGFVTTPWDMMVNQALEIGRHDERHGSCGLGFGETVGRCETTDFALTVGDLASSDLQEQLISIRDEWLPRRMAELGLDHSFRTFEFAHSATLLDHFEQQCVDFIKSVELRPDGEIASASEVVFEGAQGLLLDQNASGFPYLTRSNTGIANMAAIAIEAGLDAIAPVYVTRCYLTRHGRGPMEDERSIDAWFAADDPTNQPNPWQETLRFGLLNPGKLARRIAEDVRKASSLIRVNPTLAVTCLDQVRDKFVWLENEAIRQGPINAFMEALAQAGLPPIEFTFSSPVNDFAICKMQNTFY